MDQMWRVSARVYAPPLCGRFQKNDAGGTSWRATPVEMRAYDVAREGMTVTNIPGNKPFPSLQPAPVLERPQSVPLGSLTETRRRRALAIDT